MRIIAAAALSLCCAAPGVAQTAVPENGGAAAVVPRVPNDITTFDRPTDIGVAERFAKATLAGSNSSISDLVEPGLSVNVALRNPLTHTFIPKFQGSGAGNLSTQTDLMFQLVGKPKGVSCDQGVSFASCQFRYLSPDHALLVAVNTRGGKVSMVTYIYLTPADLKAFLDHSGNG